MRLLFSPPGCLAVEHSSNYRRHVETFEQFQQRMLRAITHIHWQDRITNARILEHVKLLYSIEAHIGRSMSVCLSVRALLKIYFSD